MSLAPVIARAADELERHGVDAPRETAERLLMHVLEIDRTGLYGRRDGLDSRTARLFGRALRRRCVGIPLQHLTGEQGFLDLVLRVAPGVFVPRPETEVVVERALETLVGAAAPVVADVGTGTGAIALAIKRARPDARVLATDVSDRALGMAAENASRHDLEVELLRGDLLDPLPPDLRGRVDLVVSNPPYVTREEYERLPPEVRRDPAEALLGGTEVHRRLAREAWEWLVPGGWLVMEIGASQGEEVRRVVANRFAEVRVLPDLTGRDRLVRGRRERGGSAD